MLWSDRAAALFESLKTTICSQWRCRQNNRTYTDVFSIEGAPSRLKKSQNRVTTTREQVLTRVQLLGLISSRWLPSRNKSQSSLRFRLPHAMTQETEEKQESIAAIEAHWYMLQCRQLELLAGGPCASPKFLEKCGWVSRTALAHQKAPECLPVIKRLEPIPLLESLLTN
jgi:hypothetical protein